MEQKARLRGEHVRTCGHLQHGVNPSRKRMTEVAISLELDLQP